MGIENYGIVFLNVNKYARINETIKTIKICQKQKLT